MCFEHWIMWKKNVILKVVFSFLYEVLHLLREGNNFLVWNLMSSRVYFHYFVYIPFWHFCVNMNKRVLLPIKYWLLYACCSVRNHKVTCTLKAPWKYICKRCWSETSINLIDRSIELLIFRISRLCLKVNFFNLDETNTVF